MYTIYDTTSNNEILLSLYEKYLVKIWIVMTPGRQCKFHAPSPPLAAHKLLMVHICMFVYTSVINKDIKNPVYLCMQM